MLKPHEFNLLRKHSLIKLTHCTHNIRVDGEPNGELYRAFIKRSDRGFLKFSFGHGVLEEERIQCEF